MRGRCTDPRPARVHVLVLTRPPHTHACTHVQRGYTKSGLYWLEVKGASGHRRAAQIAANLDDWTQRGPEKERGEAGPAGGSLGYCDMTSMGGGWLMCYTSQGEVDVANEVASGMRLRMCMAVPPRVAPSERGEIHARSFAACTCARCLLTRRHRARARVAVKVAYDARLPFGVDGYRADCRDYVFSEVLYVRHLDEAAPSSPHLSSRTTYTSFQAVGRSPTTLSAGSWLEGSAADGEEGGGGGWGGGRGGIYKDGEAWLGGVAGDVYGRYRWQVRGSEEEWEWGGLGRNPEELAKEGGYRTEVQLNVCANSGAAVGLFFSGVVPGGGCTDGFKTCADTCGDSSSAHYRHAAPGDGGGRGGGASSMCDAGSLLAEPVGLRSRALLLDSALSASSARSSNESAAQARLHGAGFWRAASAGREEFLQVTLPAEEAHVIALAVQGGGGSWLSSFKLAFTRLADEASKCRGAALPNDPAGTVGDAREVCAKAWTMVSDAEGEHVVYSVDTYDGDSVVLVSLTSQQRPAGLRAKRLRIYPMAWGGASGGGGGGLRLEVYRGVCSGVARAGVSVGETPMLAPRPQLVSVGLRHAQSSCAAGWSGNGVECSCPAEAYVGVLAYWRFESARTVPSSYWHVVDSVCQRALPLSLASPPSHA